jgi:predicted nucleic acid-binding protein
LAKKLKQKGVKKTIEELELSLFKRFDNLPVIALQERDYQSKKALAKELVSQRDPKDIDILALTLKTKAPLWSQDKDFEPVAKDGHIKLLKTSQVIIIMSKLGH